LQQSPYREAEKADRDGDQEDVTERLPEQASECILAVGDALAGPDRSQRRKAADQQEHDPPRGVTNPRQHLPCS
jgi:hypothetical protein